jgi:hypothetical protein
MTNTSQSRRTNGRNMAVSFGVERDATPGSEEQRGRYTPKDDAAPLILRVYTVYS